MSRMESSVTRWAVTPPVTRLRFRFVDFSTKPGGSLLKNKGSYEGNRRGYTDSDCRNVGIFDSDTGWEDEVTL